MIPTLALEPALRMRSLARGDWLCAAGLLVAGVCLLAALAGWMTAVPQSLARSRSLETAQAREALQRRGLPLTPRAYISAATRGDLAALRLFLAAQMPVDGQEARQPGTALAAAVRAGQEAAVDLLLGAGADAGAGAGRWGSALLAAAVQGHLRLTGRLLRTRPGVTALDEAYIGAARHGHPAVLRLLQAHGADVARLRQRALIAAAGHAPPRAAAAGHASSGAVSAGQEPSHSAAMPMVRDQAAAVRLLLEAGADPRAREEETGLTPLHHAAYGGDVASAAVLLAHGADPEARDAEGCTPLWWAAGTGAVEMVALLIAHGADPRTRADDGTSALARAQNIRHAGRMERLLADAGR